jgi:hypothetical protein
MAALPGVAGLSASAFPMIRCSGARAELVEVPLPNRIGSPNEYLP